MMQRDIFGVIAATSSAVGGLIIILFKVDPFRTSVGITSLFYFALFLSIWGIGVLAGYNIRRLILKNFMPEKIMSVSFWQGLIIAGAITGFLILNKF